MFNTVQLHNSYHIKVFKDNKCIEEKTIYNSANPSMYIRSSGGISAPITLRCKYDTEQSFGLTKSWTNGTTFNRITENASFNGAITFVGSTYFSSLTVPEDAENISWSMGVGNGFNYKEDPTDPFEQAQTFYWSEASYTDGFTTNILEEDVKVYIEVTLNFILTPPSGLTLYDDRINYLLQNDTKHFPAVFPNKISLSALRTYPNILMKQIPIITDLPTTRVVPDTPTSNGSLKQTDNTANGLFIKLDGETDVPGALNYNVGCASTIVYQQVGAAPLYMSMSNNKPIPVPIAILTPTIINELYDSLEDGEKIYYYCSAPIGSQITSVKIAGFGGSESWALNYIAPPQRFEFTEDSTHNFSYLCDNTDTTVDINKRNLYYSNFILSDTGYWEPATGSPVTSKYINLPVQPTNYRFGNNISFNIQGKNAEDTEWHNCRLFNADSGEYISSTAYKTYYLQKEDYENYRVSFSIIPSTAATGYYVNAAEEEIIHYKAYDKNVVLIGTSTEIYDDNGSLIEGVEGEDFGRCGAVITKNILAQLKQGIINNNSAKYYIYGLATNSTYFYKTNDLTMTLTYGFNAQGA